MDLGFPHKTALVDCTTHAQGFEEKQSLLKAHFEMGSNFQAAVNFFLQASEGNGGSLQLGKSHQLYESCEVKSN